MEKAWRESVDSIVAQLSESDLREVVLRLRPIAQRGDTLVVEAPNKLAAAVVRERCLEALREALEQASGGELRKLTLILPSAAQQELFPTPAPPPKPGKSVLRRSALLPKYTFDNFVVGPCNRFAHAASKAVANQPAITTTRSSSTAGRFGARRTSVNAIGHQVLDDNEDARVVHLSSDSFMNELIACGAIAWTSSKAVSAASTC